HAGLGRLLGHWLVRENAGPDLAATLDVTGHRDTGRFDLARSDPARFEGLNAEVAEGQVDAALGLAGHTPTMLLAVFYLAGHQHGYSASFRKCGASTWSWPVRRSISSSTLNWCSTSALAARRSAGLTSSTVSSTTSSTTGSASTRRRPPPARTTPFGAADALDDPMGTASPAAMAASRTI